MKKAYSAALLGGLFSLLTGREVAAEETARMRIRGRAAERRVVTAPAQVPVARWVDEPVHLQAAPEGVEELKFADFFRMPVGAGGLEVTDRLRSLEGRRVRLVGYFVFEDWSTCACPSPEPLGNRRAGRVQPGWMQHVIPGRVMMSGLPMSVSLGHYGLSEDLPPQLVFVRIKSRYGEPVFHRPGLFAVTGKLTLGNREEPDGRVSFVRLDVEEESEIQPVGYAAAHEPKRISETQSTQSKKP
jgi:hypothetical protein